MLNDMGVWLRLDIAKCEYFMPSFVSDFTDETGLQQSQGPETRQSLEEKNMRKGDQVREHLCQLDKDKSMNPDVIDTPESRWKVAQYC